MRLLLSHGWQFFLYTAGLAFSSLKEWELAFLLYTSGTAISLYTAGIAIFPVYGSDRSFDLGMRPVRQCDLHLPLSQD